MDCVTRIDDVVGELLAAEMTMGEWIFETWLMLLINDLPGLVQVLL